MEVTETHRAVIGDDARLAIAGFYVGGRSLQFVGCDLLQFLGKGYASTGDKDTTERDRTQTAYETTLDKLVSIALVNAELWRYRG